MPDKHITTEQLLALLQKLIFECPAFSDNHISTEAEKKWLGRADALIEATGLTLAGVQFRAARRNFTSRPLGQVSRSRSEMLQPLYDALGHLELRVPDTLQGAFIPPGDTWNGYAAIVKLIQKATENFLLIDPYLNSDLFLNFIPNSNENVLARCLTTRKPKYHDGILAASNKWESSGKSNTRPVAIRYVEETDLHDRLLLIDGKDAWSISQSIKVIGAKSAASVSLLDAELSDRKISHYQRLWETGAPIN